MPSSCGPAPCYGPAPRRQQVGLSARGVNAPGFSRLSPDLLYAQPLSRVLRLTLDDVIRDGTQVLLRLGEPPRPVPAPASDLLLEWIDNRGNMNTATNRNSPWLFPGRKAGQPVNPNALAELVSRIGIPASSGRASAIRQHVLELPAPVVADALSYHPATTAKLAAQVGATFSRYAPGDHERPSAGGGDS